VGKSFEVAKTMSQLLPENFLVKTNFFEDIFECLLYKRKTPREGMIRGTHQKNYFVENLNVAICV